MLKKLARLEAIVEGKVGHFLVDHDASNSVAKEMCFQFLKYIGQIEDTYKAQQEIAKKSENETAPIQEPIVP